MTKVTKRNGEIVPFNEEKIVKAILAAMKEVGEVNEETAKAIADTISKEDDCTVEKIQNMVEEELMRYGFCEVARAYIRYRYRHELMRDDYAVLMTDIAEKLDAEDVQNQNANVDEHSFGGRIGEATNLLMKQYALEYCMTAKSRNNHLNNEVYIHDLDKYAVGCHNCLTIPFDDLLSKGFNTRQTDVRPASSINTAFQLLAVIFQLQSLQQFGGVSASHLDWTMVPYVRKSFAKHWKDGQKYVARAEININPSEPIEYSFLESNYPKLYKYAMDMTEKEIHQAVEGMYHNLNTLQSRSGCQLPFTSINYGTCTLPEGRMITKALLEVSLEGVGRLHKTPIFPCGIFQIMEGVNKREGDPNYDLFRLALKSTAVRLYPNYANVDWSVNAGYDKDDPTTYVSTMGCRTYNGFDINGLGFKKDGRGNLAPVTIIMPTLAMEAKEKAIASGFGKTTNDCLDPISAFMEILDQKIHEARDMLIERYEFMCAQPVDSAKFMYENNTMAGFDGKSIRSALQHGTLVIGQLGLAETLQILIGCDHTEPKGMELAKRIEALFNKRCKEFKEELHLNFGVYYTPAENLCYTAMKKFRQKYGIIPNISENDFFTNSIHVPVWKEIGAFEKIDIESELTGYSNAGCITYVELDSSAKNNIDALEQLVVYAMDKDIPYFAVNTPNDLCTDCGFTEQIDEDDCPRCGGDHIQRLRRVTGYLTGDYKTAFNYGKQKETEMRFKHSEKMDNWEKI